MSQEKVDYIVYAFWEHAYASGKVTEEEYLERKDKEWTMYTLQLELIAMGFDEDGERDNA